MRWGGRGGPGGGGGVAGFDDGPPALGPGGPGPLLGVEDEQLLMKCGMLEAELGLHDRAAEHLLRRPLPSFRSVGTEGGGGGCSGEGGGAASGSVGGVDSVGCDGGREARGEDG